MIYVGISKTVDKKNGKERLVRYSDITVDDKGWADSNLYRPIPFDILYLKIEEPVKIKSGWYTGEKWTGLRLKEKDNVLAWKRQLYDYALG